jgi:hypothetical protein
MKLGGIEKDYVRTTTKEYGPANVRGGEVVGRVVTSVER